MTVRKNAYCFVIEKRVVYRMKSIAILFYFTKERGNKYVLFNKNGFGKFLEMVVWVKE